MHRTQRNKDIYDVDGEVFYYTGRNESVKDYHVRNANVIRRQRWGERLHTHTSGHSDNVR